MSDDKVKRIHELNTILKAASNAYYNENKEIMSNYEYDALYDELLELEKETNIVLSGSPTVSVGYEALSELKKVVHESPMLSLDKTKDIDALVAFVKDKEAVLSFKEDGLTTVLTYENGELVSAVTRGNGTVGEDITHNAKVFANLPKSISYKDRLVIRGESVISYSEFEAINKRLSVEDQYKNPRNLCSGTVRQLDSAICAKRNVKFIAFQLVGIDDSLGLDTISKRFDYLASLGFEVVVHKKVNKDNLADTVSWFEGEIATNDIPSDGLVLTFDDIAYGESLGRTAKFPKNAIAFKWKDELATTSYIETFWSASRTGMINPVAIFEPVELEGTTVSRASLHNVSIFEDYQLGKGDQITVYKANMIIPQLQDNLTRSNTETIPEFCPVCHAKTSIKDDNSIKVLYCDNKECPAKKIKSFAHFVSRDAANIDGMSEATIERLIENGCLKELSDLYHLDRYKDIIVGLEGFGDKSYSKLVKACDKSRDIKTSAFLYSLGISNIGSSNAKLICKHFKDDFIAIRNASVEELARIDGIGELIAKAIVKYFNDDKNIAVVDSLIEEMNIIKEEYSESGLIFDGVTFVVTGSLNHYSNRKELANEIESLGGKVASSVSAKTNYLINNDATSSSSKNKKAKELGVKIITEEEYISIKNMEDD
ncbi:MAG: NAD-dependent DNA ligase LigA [Lachnospiraceae bacterium]|nr:NAD-dependent DNA ligase LigA [Lachnospiraceae bacterium]